MDREDADRQLTELSKAFIREFRQRVDEFDMKDLKDMEFLCIQFISLMLKCKQRGIKPRNAYIMFGIMTSYMKILKEVME